MFDPFKKFYHDPHLNIHWAKAPFREDNSKFKYRPVLVLDHDRKRHQATVLRITTKYKHKSRFIKSFMFPIKHWKEANLRKPSYVNTIDRTTLPDRYIENRPVGFLGCNTCKRMFTQSIKAHQVVAIKDKVRKQFFSHHQAYPSYSHQFKASFHKYTRKLGRNFSGKLRKRYYHNKKQYHRSWIYQDHTQRTNSRKIHKLHKLHKIRAKSFHR